MLHCCGTRMHSWCSNSCCCRKVQRRTYLVPFNLDSSPKWTESIRRLGRTIEVPYTFPFHQSQTVDFCFHFSNIVTLSFSFSLVACLFVSLSFCFSVSLSLSRPLYPAVCNHSFLWRAKSLWHGQINKENLFLLFWQLSNFSPSLTILKRWFISIASVNSMELNTALVNGVTIYFIVVCN